MGNLPPTYMVMMGVVIAAILAIIGQYFSSTVNHMQNVSKLRSDWIDSLRHEISLFSSQVTIISLLWDLELKAKNCMQLSDQDFCRFRNKHKEAYQELFESYSSISLRLDCDKTEYKDLKICLDNTVASFTGNNSKCSVDSKNMLNQIIEKAGQVIKKEREKIEVETLNQQKAYFWKDFLIAVAIVLISIILILLVNSNSTRPPLSDKASADVSEEELPNTALKQDMPSTDP